MKTLPTEFVSGEGGYSAAPLTYKQVVREGLLAIYQRFYEDGKPKDFEVVKLRVIPAGTAIFGQPPSIEDEERYAVTSSWGKCGWSFSHLIPAQNKFIDLKNDLVNDAENEAASTDVEVDGVKYFTVGQYATNHNMPYVNANLIIKELITKGSVKFIGEKRLNAKGKSSRIYSTT